MPIVTTPDSAAECAICQELKCRENGVIWQLEAPCGHDFHQACLAQMLDHNQNASCPLCRVLISPIDKAGITGDSPESRYPVPNQRSSSIRHRNISNNNIQHNHHRSHPSWHQLLQQARIATRRTATIRNAQDPGAISRVDNFFEALAAETPRRGYEPTFTELVEAFQDAINNEPGSIQIDDRLFEYRPTRTTESPESVYSRQRDMTGGRSHGFDRSQSGRGHTAAGYHEYNPRRSGYEVNEHPSSRNDDSHYNFLRFARPSRRPISTRHINDEERQQERGSGGLETVYRFQRDARPSHRSISPRHVDDDDGGRERGSGGLDAETGLEEEFERALQLSTELHTAREEEVLRRALEESLRHT